MKKKIAFTIVLGNVILSSCEKRQQNPCSTSTNQTSNDYSSLLTSLNTKTDAFVSKEHASANNAKIKWEIVKADFAGAAAGAAAGATIGGAIGGPGGAIGGALGGGIGGAILYSIAKANEGALRTISPITNPNQGVIVNPLNSYEIVGSTHNLVINEALKNPDAVLENEQISPIKVYNFTTSLVSKLPELGGNFNIYLPFSAYNDLNSLYIQNPNKNLVAFLNELKHDNKITWLEASILHSYSTGLNSIKEVSDFQVYSIDIENTIISSNVPDKSKAIVLGFMAASRYSVAYWNVTR